MRCAGFCSTTRLVAIISAIGRLELIPARKVPRFLGLVVIALKGRLTLPGAADKGFSKFENSKKRSYEFT
jgi:hypothetical protein